MKAVLLAFALPCLVSAQAAEILKVDGKDLKTVPGPLAHTERLRDPVSPFGNTGLDLELRRSARGGPAVPCVAVTPGNLEIAHQVDFPAGWQAYQVDVAPGEKVRARVRCDHEGWFVVRCVTRMGLLIPGMLQNLIPTGNPEATFQNLGKAPATVYFVVDTTELLYGSEPFTLSVTRN